jgi:hypothetical protein
VSRRERGRFVEEEELREAPRLHERMAVPAAEREPAGDPALAVVATADPAAIVVQAAAVAVHETARRVGDQLAERCDTVLERRRRKLASCALLGGGGATQGAHMPSAVMSTKAFATYSEGMTCFARRSTWGSSLM